MDDKEIVKLYFSRDTTAIDETSKKYGNMCLRLSNSILEDLADCEECVNDTYLVLWDTIPPQNPVSFKAYICKIVRNISFNKRRYNEASKRNSAYDLALEELENSFNFGSKNSPENEMEAREIADMINRFLGQLTKEKRILFVLRYFYLYDIREIAERFNTSEQNISTKLYRLRQSLKKHLESEGIII